MISPTHPIRNLCGNYILGLRADATPSGRLSDFNIDFEGGVVQANWEVDSSDWQMNIFNNGTFLEASTLNVWEFSPSAAQSFHSFEFLLGPSGDSRMMNSQITRSRNILRRVDIGWDLDEDITQSAVYKSELNGVTVDTTDGSELFGSIFQTPSITTEGSGSGRVTVAGKWIGDVPFASITVNIVDPGAAGVARYTWTYNGFTSEPIDTHTVYSFVVNGVKLKFESGSYVTDGTDDFTIKVKLPHTYKTDELANGRHRFKVATWRNEFKAVSDETTEITIAAVPGSATLESSSYTDGTGIATLSWSMPDELSVRMVEVVRNYPANGIGDIHWRPVYSEDIDGGAIFTYAISGLQEGVNKVCVNVVNDGERNENRAINPCYVVVLDSGLNAISYPSAPWGIEGRVESDGTITVTISADSNSDSFEIYHDNQTGTIDYNTIWATVTNPQSTTYRLQEILKELLFLPDGDYIIAARAKTGSIVEDNTDIYAPLTVDTTPPSMAENLTAVLSS